MTYFKAVAVAAALLATLSPARLPAASILVDTLDDEFVADGDCSLREALYAANNNLAFDDCETGASGLDDILLSLPGQINLTAPLMVEESLFIRGTGWSASRISGQNNIRVLEVDMSGSSAHDLTIVDLSIQQGFSDDSDGGALFAYHVPALSIEDVLFGGNRIRDEFNPNARGGAIHLRSQGHESGSSLTLIERSSFIDNTSGANGGAISLDGPVVASIRNSTFHGNDVASSGGGAVDADGDSTVAVFFSTFHDNGSGPVRVSSLAPRGSGSSSERTLAARDGASITLATSIISTSWSTAMDCEGDIRSNGFNIDSGSSCTSELSDLSGTDPELEPLSPFSSPDLAFELPILLPQPESPAIEGGWRVCPGPFGTTTTEDQRGLPRPVPGPARGDDTRCDIGAIEFRRLDQPMIFQDRFQS
jgi:CSLREA domain-containing protein